MTEHHCDAGLLVRSNKTVACQASHLDGERVGVEPLVIELVDLATRIVGKAVVYFTPINVEAGARLAGCRFTEIVKANVATVFSLLSDADAVIEDWSGALPDSAFFRNATTTEHLNENGRCYLAEKVQAACRA